MFAYKNLLRLTTLFLLHDFSSIRYKIWKVDDIFLFLKETSQTNYNRKLLASMF